MLFPSCRRILLFPLLFSPHGPNKIVLDPSCTWIRCTKVSSWYSNGPFNSDLVETFKTNAFNAFVLDRVIGPFGTCNGSLLVFLGWSTSASICIIARFRESFWKFNFPSARYVFQCLRQSSTSLYLWHTSKKNSILFCYYLWTYK